MKKLVAYYRVSTQKQGISGLGLEAQKKDVEGYASKEGAELAKTFREVETGKRKKKAISLDTTIRDLFSNRPELAKAIEYVQKTGATLVIAKLDRLVRDVLVTSALMATGVDFVALDNPVANSFTIHILAAVAEQEARSISERTKKALQALKARGVKLGASNPNCNNLTAERRLMGTEATKAKAALYYKKLIPLVKQWRDNGCTLPAIAAHLNEYGYTTQTGKPFHSNGVQIARLLQRG